MHKPQKRVIMPTASKKTTKSRKTTATRKNGVIASKKRFSLSSKQRFSAFVVAIFVIAGVGYFGYGALRNFQAQATAFEYVGTHPQASTETTDRAKSIKSLINWNGKIYSGYGDWDANTGPVSISPFDPATGKFSTTPEFVSETEAIEIFKVINKKLYAVHVDPRGGWGATYSVADNSSGTPTWQNIQGRIPYTHTYGITAGFSPSEMFISGQSDEGSATNEVAKIYRTTDEGATWTQSLSVPSRGGFNRMMLIAKFNNKIIAQSYSSTDFNGAGVQSTAWSWDGSRWASANPIAASLPYDATEFAGKLILKSSSTGGSLLAYDGRTTTTARSSITDYVVGDDGYLYTLGYQGYGSSSLVITRTKDLTTWENISYAPAQASAIGYLDNTLYVGTRDSKLYKAAINPNVIDSTAPTVSLLSPSNGVTIGPSYSLLAATASDSAGIDRVEYYVDSQMVGVTTTTSWLMHSDGLTNPYPNSYGSKWNGVGVPAGSHQFKAIAYDPYGNATSTAPITINVPEGLTPPDNTPPTVSVAYPSATTRNIRGSLTITGTATDNSKLAYMEIQLDGKTIAFQNSTSGTITSVKTPVLKGSHTIIVIAKDAAGNSSQATRTFSSK